MALVGAVAGWPIAARAQQIDGVRRIGILLSSGGSDPQMQARFAAFREELGNRGWAGGDNIRLELRWFGGNAERATVYAKELSDLAPDVIVVNSTLGIEAVLRATRNVPTVFVLVGDPVGGGYVASLAHPGGNVTGFSAFEPEIIGKWIQTLKEIAPAVRQAAVLFFPGYDFLWHGAETAAAVLGLAVTQATCRTAAEIEPTIAAIASRPNRALVVMPTPLFGSHRDTIIGSAARHGLPAVYPFRYFAEAGGLLSYGIDTVDVFRRAASYVDRILKGENPGDLPVQTPTKFELVINLKTARALGLTVPPSLLARADEVIE